MTDKQRIEKISELALEIKELMRAEGELQVISVKIDDDNFTQIHCYDEAKFIEVFPEHYTDHDHSDGYIEHYQSMLFGSIVFALEKVNQ